ncbi:MAG TPA: cytochrome c oxidase assembly protein [Rhodanobacteraceae bacterium]|nr:cytochrome c oxidase assembly protein [Rhodanobacteraceae bacterium]
MAFFDWFIPWEPSPGTAVCLLLAAGLYLRGALRSPMTAPWPRQLAFWLGLALIYVGLQTHFDYYAEHQFFMHRLQHLGLHHMGPFLIALAFPAATFRRGLPVSWRRRVLMPALHLPPVRWFLAVVLNPWVAAFLFVGIIYFWLWPAVHFIAMLDHMDYRLMNWSVTLDGLLFWWLILDPRPRPPARLAPGVRILVALAVMPPQIVLGAWIFFSRQHLYPLYELCGRAFAGVTPTLDQHLGGLILWIPGAMMSVIAALIALAHWTSLSRRGRLPRRGRQHIAASAAPAPHPEP